jgi:hypothetical protein
MEPEGAAAPQGKLLTREELFQYHTSEETPVSFGEELEALEIPMQTNNVEADLKLCCR